MVREDENTPDRPGGYTMRVVPAKGRPTLHKRRSERADALASWLLAEWRREREEAKR